MSDEFRRLLDDAPNAELRSVLESGLSDQPSPRAITRAARTLGISAAGLASARVAAAAASRTLRASPWTVLAKWGGAGFLLGGIALSPVVLKTHAESQARRAQQGVARASAARASEVRASEQRAQANALEPTPAPTQEADDGVQSTSRAAVRENSAEFAEQRGESAAALARGEAKPVANTAGSSVAASNAVSSLTPRGAESSMAASRGPSANSESNATHALDARNASRGNDASNAHNAPSAARADLLDGEIALLDATRTALRQGDSTTALALLDRHARLAVRALGAEATLLRVQAFVLAGRSDEARALARAALGGRNALPYAARLRKLAGLDQ
jgi:hypothetical protein